MLNNYKKANHLLNQKSLYLQQHAYNPVNWFPWSIAAFNKARNENKPIILSIGYSACHWCHVMNKETFSDQEVAKIMNKYYVCIKVDREERPDVDNLYMEALALMEVPGGWPLNCFLTPDGKPFWGITYCPLNEWKELLLSIKQLFDEQFQKVQYHAEAITNKLKSLNNIRLQNTINLPEISLLNKIYANIRRRFDFRDGGFAYTPKFPMPVSIDFLFKYGCLANSDEAIQQALLTLEKISMGGIYDHLAGGFSRYAIDIKWKIPHFEKMLYDNALLVSNYVDAYKLSKNEYFKQVINETLNFISESMTDVQGYFYSAIAADSEGVEGKYYMWSYKQINQILDKDVGIFSKFYGIDAKNPCNESIMFATQTVKQFAKRHFLNYDDFNQLLINCKKKLLVERNKRLAPTVDKKSITAWNALMLNAFVKAFHITGNTNYIDIAINNATFILNNMKMPDGGLYHVYIDKQPSIEGFLDDYAYTITAFLSLYEVTFNRIYLYEAEKWLEYVIEHFNDENTNFFYYTSNKDDSFLIIRKIEYYDNVIPSANSSLARVLLLLSRIFNKTQWKNRAINMLNSIIYDMIDNPYLYFNWGILLTELIADFYIITIIDKNAINKANKINQYYLPFKFLINDNFFNIELDKEKTLDKKNIYICNDHKCMIAFTNIKDVLKEIKLNCKK